LLEHIDGEVRRDGTASMPVLNLSGAEK